MTREEAQRHLADATASVDAVIEEVLDQTHDAMIRDGVSERAIDVQMQRLLAMAHEAR